MSQPDDAAFTHEIRVGWGDCDPARIAYTGHIPGWALQAIDAWWEAHLVLLGMGASIATTLLTLNLVADLYMLLIVPKASSYDALDDTAGKNPLREPPPPTVGLRRFSSKRGGGPGDESKV